MSLRSTADELENSAGRIMELVRALATHCSVHSPHVEPVRPSSVAVISFQGLIKEWGALSVEGLHAQQRVHEEYGRFRELVQALLRNRVESVRRRFKNADRIVSRFIGQEGSPGSSVPTEITSVEEALKEQLQLVSDAEDSLDHWPEFLPDTNALLFNPHMEDWNFAQIERFRLVIAPTVLAELDKLKIIGRSSDLRDKAEGVIRRLKEYRRRGQLHRGVVLRAGKVELRSLAVEPDMSTSLSWLKPENDDDRILASVVEVMGARPHSPVLFVTRDINAQNKAEFASINFIEPPAAPAASR